MNDDTNGDTSTVITITFDSQGKFGYKVHGDAGYLAIQGALVETINHVHDNMQADIAKNKQSAIVQATAVPKFKL
jgi:hypothetical protein